MVDEYLFDGIFHLRPCAGLAAYSLANMERLADGVLTMMFRKLSSEITFTLDVLVTLRVNCPNSTTSIIFVLVKKIWPFWITEKRTLGRSREGTGVFAVKLCNLTISALVLSFSSRSLGHSSRSESTLSSRWRFSASAPFCKDSIRASCRELSSRHLPKSRSKFLLQLKSYFNQQFTQLKTKKSL